MPRNASWFDIGAAIASALMGDRVAVRFGPQLITCKKKRCVCHRGQNVHGWVFMAFDQTETAQPFAAPQPLAPEVANAYELLGLRPSATLDQVKTRRRDLAKTHHPDRHGKANKKREAEKKMQAINNAADIVEKHIETREQAAASR